MSDHTPSPAPQDFKRERHWLLEVVSARGFCQSRQKVLCGATTEDLSTAKVNAMDDSAQVIEKRLELIQRHQVELAQATANRHRLMQLCDAHVRELDELAPKLVASASAEDYAAAQNRLNELALEQQRRDAARQQAREAVDRRTKDYAALIAEYSQAPDDDSIEL